MKKINKSRFAILGMLVDKPRSGYDIRKFMSESTIHFWQESDASIYPMLKLLEREGKVTSQARATGLRKSKVFAITAKGKKEFLDWLSLPAESEGCRSEFLLKIFFGQSDKPKNIIKQLYSRLEKAQATRKAFKNIEENVFTQIPDKDPRKVFWKLTLRYGILDNEAELKWLGESIKILKPLDTFSLTRKHSGRAHKK